MFVETTTDKMLQSFFKEIFLFVTKKKHPRSLLFATKPDFVGLHTEIYSVVNSHPKKSGIKYTKI